jgi:FkbM family methyltransferase
VKLINWNRCLQLGTIAHLYAAAYLRQLKGQPGIRKLKQQYWEATDELLASGRALFSRDDASSWLLPWLKSIVLAPNSPGYAWPELPFAGTVRLQGILSANSRVLVCGSSTAAQFCASRVAELVYLEHDKDAFRDTDSVLKVIESRGQLKVQAELIEPELRNEPGSLPSGDPLAYTSPIPPDSMLSFQKYARRVEDFPDQYFDLIVIDGPSRASCFMYAVAKLRFEGYIVLNSAEQDSDRYILETGNKLGFENNEFWSPGPYRENSWCAVFMQRVKDKFALNELDTKLEQYLDFDNGVFVEAGANDGIRQSNSLYFEARRGWRGVLVEAVPALYEECRRNRPQAQVVWGALAPPDQVPGQLTIRYAGLMSVVKGGMASLEEENAHVAIGLEVQKLDTYEAIVPTFTLSNVLDSCGITKVDLLCLDLEGFEGPALAGLELARHKPTYILVEARYRNEVDAQLLPHYEIVANLSHHDILYRAKY